MTSSVQSVERCLAVLEFLNIKNGATQKDVCKATGLSRGSAYRSLETLRRQGYLRKDKGSLHYWLADRVQALANGYKEESWIEDVVKPEIAQLGRRIKWPVKFLSLFGGDLINRVTTDHETPFTAYKYATEWRVSMIWSAAGRVFLAYCDGPTRDKLVERAGALEGPPVTAPAETIAKTDLAKILAGIRERGFEFRQMSTIESHSMAVPVLAGPRVIGALSVMMFRATLTEEQAVATYLPLMQATAHTIGERVAAVAQPANTSAFPGRARKAIKAGYDRASA